MGPSHQDGLMLDLGTRNGVDLEATEQGFGVKRSGFRPKWLGRCGASAPGAVRRQGGSGNRLDTGVVDGRLGGVGVRGEERALGWPYLRAVREGSGEPLPDAVDAFRVLYLTGKFLYPCGDRAYRRGGMGLMLCTVDCFDILLKGACREESPAFRRRA